MPAREKFGGNCSHNDPKTHNPCQPKLDSHASMGKHSRTAGRERSLWPRKRWCFVSPRRAVPAFPRDAAGAFPAAAAASVSTSAFSSPARPARPPRVIALDLDGTLLGSDGAVSPRNAAAVQACAERGLRVVIASARPPRSVGRLLPPDFPAQTWVCYNGAEVWHAGERVIHRALAPDAARELIACLEGYAPQASIAVECDDQLFANRPLRQPWEHCVVDLRAAVIRPISKIVFAADESADLRALAACLPSEYSLVVTDGGSLGHIMAPGVSKALSLAALLADWGLTLDDVIAFGDDANDLDLIAAAGTGVAMGNAIPDLKAAADLVTASNDDDGVALVLERIVVNSEILGQHSMCEGIK